MQHIKSMTLFVYLKHSRPDFLASFLTQALREELFRMLEADPSAKAIVFSQFTSMLDIINFRLEQVRVMLV